MPFRPNARVIHSHPRPLNNHTRFRLVGRGDVEIVAEQVVVVEAFINVHRAAKQTRPAGPARDIVSSAHSGTCGILAGSAGATAAIRIDCACSGTRRTTVAVTPESRRLKFGTITSISFTDGIGPWTYHIFVLLHGLV